jgi:aryl-alcohol dehydrogenase-like predicted oxidoreductase
VRYVEFAGWKLSKVGLGTAQFANPLWGYGADHRPHDLVRRALALGINHFDTSDYYGAGHSERILGTALRDVEGVLVATKLFNVAPSARLVTARARASIERLGGPLPLCYLSWANPFVSDRPLMAGMRRLRAKGLVAEVGVSGYDLARWQAAERHLGAPVLVNEVEYNLLRRDAEEALLPWAAAEGRLIVAAQPLAAGFLSGAYHQGKRVSGPLRTSNRLFSASYLGRTTELAETLKAVAKEYDATAAQVALAYVLHQPNVVAIPGAATAGQLAENAAAVDLELTEDERRALAEAASRCPASRAPASGLRSYYRAAKHWAKGARLVAAMAREDRRLKLSRTHGKAEDQIDDAPDPLRPGTPASQ